MELRRIVIGVDFSGAAEAAARWIAEHFGENTELMLVHAVDMPAPPGFLRGMLPPHDELVETTRRGAEARLREVAGRLPAERLWTEVREGRPAEVLLEAVREFDAAFLVVGEHGPRRGVWDLLGSTAEQAVRESPVPVLVARGLPQEAPRRILAAVSASEVGPHVLEWTKLLADRFDAEVAALFVLSPMLYGRMHRLAAGSAVGEEAGVERGAREWLEERLKDAGLAGSAAVTTWGDPGHEILAAADRFGAELIVLGSRGTRTLGRGLLGTVTRAVLRGGTVPVLVVPQRVDG